MSTRASTTTTRHRTLRVDGLDIFFREAGDATQPTLLLLHGFPTSSLMFRNLIPALADRFHLVAPDYPGFGRSAFPDPATFEYSFESLYEVVLGFVDALDLERFAIYIQDYGAPIGLRLAQRNPDRVTALITQSGNAYTEGFTPFWEPLFTQDRATSEPLVRQFTSYEALKWQYTHGTRRPDAVPPDTWELDHHYLERPGNREMQLELLYDYENNLELYPAFQAYLRTHRPPTLIVWGRNDEIFGPAGAEAYTRDVPDAELHLLDTGHFALEEELEFIATRIRDFLDRNAT